MKVRESKNFITRIPPHTKENSKRGKEEHNNCDIQKAV
jgi:hypothetical protein